MSIVVKIIYTGEKDNAIKFAKEMESSGIASYIRDEAGNEAYEYFLPINNNGSVVLIDKWADQKALDIHHALPLMKDIMLLREKYDIHMTVEKFVSVENSDSSDDSKFIRL